MLTEKILLNKERNVILTAYIQQTGGEFSPIEKRPVVLILPGGAYAYCSDQEADPVAFPYLKAGYHVCILRYSVMEHAVWPNPLNDYETAAEYIKSKEDEWHLYPDKIVVVGFSAGGHLAACSASMAENRPVAAILGYAAVADETISLLLPSAPDATAAVNENTCPCFIFAGRNDTTVPVMNSVKMMEALIKNDISFESHIYASATHGFGIGNSTRGYDADACCSRVPRWTEDSIEWLRDMVGDFGPKGFDAPRYDRIINGNHNQFYSIDCTVDYIVQNSKTAEIIEPYLEQVKAMFHIEGEPKSFYNLKIQELLQMCGVSPEKARELDEVLCAIENIR